MQSPVPLLRIRLPRRGLLLVITTALGLVIAFPAVAEYLGPDRIIVVEVDVRDPDHDLWTMERGDPPVATCTIRHTCEEHPSVERQMALCGWIASNSGCDRAYRTEERTTTLPEATVIGDLQNCDPNNGWCTRSPTLHLTASEPLAGEVVTVIEGARNGEPFACAGDACDVPLQQGGNIFSFWALSSYGDSSRMGNLSAQVDTVPPSSAFSDPPEGSVVWVSGVLPLAGSSSDATSGLANAELSLDGGASWLALGLGGGGSWAYGWDTTTVPDGAYHVLVRASDLAGHLESTAQVTVHVDNSSPSINVPDSWYIWEPLAIQFDDSGTGVKKVSLTIEGEEYGNRSYKWSAGNVPDDFIWDRHFGDVIAPIGEYPVTVEAWDRVGNKSTARGEILIPNPASQAHTTDDVSSGTSTDPAALRSEPADEAGGQDTVIIVATLAALAPSLGGEEAAGQALSANPPDRGRVSPSTSTAQLTAAAPATNTGILWGAAAATLGTAATAYALRRRQERRQPAAVTTMQAIGQPLPTGMTLPEFEGEDGWLVELLPFLSQVTSGASDVVDGVIEFTRDTDVEVSAATALRRLFNPSMSPSVSEEMTRYIWDLFSRNPRLSDADAFLERINEWAPANRRAYPVNLRDLQDFLNAIRSEDAMVSGNGVVALLLILAGGKLALSHPWEGNLLQKLGGSLGSAGDVWQGARLLTDSAKYAEYAQLLSTPWGAVTSGFTGGAGLLQFAWNWNRLASDPTISDLASNERWGVALQSLGGGLLMVGGAAGFAIALSLGTGAILAALPILVPLGLVVGGVGWVVENWDWIGSGLAAWPGVIEMGGTIVKKTVVEPITDGARAWSGIVDNGREIARALPRYVNEQVNETVIQPLASRLGTWPGIIHNAGEIARAAPGYIKETVIEPAVSAVLDRVVEPVSRGLSAWGGVVDNGRTIVQAAPKYVNERVIQPAIRTVTESIVRPAVQAISQRIVQPVQNTLSRAASAIKSIFGG